MLDPHVARLPPSCNPGLIFTMLMRRTRLGGAAMGDVHTEREDFPWMIAVVDHPPRTDSPAYRRSRTLMHKLVETTPDWVLAGDQYQDHHGGSVWVTDQA